jgi:hypothetical protein
MIARATWGGVPEGTGAAPTWTALSSQRLLRAIFTVGDRYPVLARGRTLLLGEFDEDFERRAAGPVRALFQRGIDDATLRDDLSAGQLAQLFGGLVLAAYAAEMPRAAGVDVTEHATWPTEHGIWPAGVNAIGARRRATALVPAAPHPGAMTGIASGHGASVTTVAVLRAAAGAGTGRGGPRRPAGRP